MKHQKIPRPFTLIYYHGNMRPGFSYEVIPEETYRRVQRAALEEEMQHFQGYAVGTKNVRPYIKGECPHHCPLYAYTQVEKVEDGFEHLFFTKEEGVQLQAAMKDAGMSLNTRH